MKEKFCFCVYNYVDNVDVNKCPKQHKLKLIILIIILINSRLNIYIIYIYEKFS